MQLRLTVEVLPRIPQVERHLRNTGASRAWCRRLAREPLGPRGRLLFPKRTVRPLPRSLPIGLGQPSRRVQVVTVDGVGLPFDDGRYRHGAAGGGQVDVLAGAAAGTAAGAVFAQQAAVLGVHVAPAQFLGVAGAGAPELAPEVEDLLDEAGGFLFAFFFFIVVGQQVVQVLAGAWGGCAAEQGLGLEHALAQGVVGVFSGGGVGSPAGGGAVQAAFAVVVVAGQAVTEQVACAVVLVGDAGAGAVAAGAGGLAEAQQAVVAGFAAVGAAGAGAGYVAGAALSVAVGVVLEGGGVCRGVGGGGSGEAGDAAGGAVLHGPGAGLLGEGAVLRVGAGGLPEVLRDAVDAACGVVLVAAEFGGGELACGVVAAGGGDGGAAAGQVPAPAGGLAQGVPGDAADHRLARPGEAGELAGGVVDVLQCLPAGVGGER